MMGLLCATGVVLHPDTFRQLLFQPLWLFSGCWMFLLDDLEDELQASFLAVSGRLSILNIQVLSYLDRWISGCALASPFWRSSLVMYNHNQEQLVSLALPAQPSFLLTENHIPWISELSSTDPLPRAEVNFCFLLPGSFKNRCCSISSTVSILQPFVTWSLQPPLLLCPIYLQLCQLPAIFPLHVLFFVHPLSILCLSIPPDKHLVFARSHYWLCFIC